MESNQNLAMPIAVVIAGAFIAVAIYFSGGRAVTPTPTNTGTPTTPTVDVAKVKTAGSPVAGSAGAPLTIAYWFDYQCPYCKINESGTIRNIVADYVKTGKVKIVFKDFAFLGPDSMTLGQWGRAVWAYAPDKFYDWHRAVFENQGQENSGWATTAKLTSLTTAVLGAEGAAKVAALVQANGSVYQKAMDADRSEGTSLGVGGTPAMIIGTVFVPGAQDYADVKAVIEKQLKK